VYSYVDAYDQAGTGRSWIVLDAGRRASELGGKSQQGQDPAEAASHSEAASLLC